MVLWSIKISPKSQSRFGPVICYLWLINRSECQVSFCLHLSSVCVSIYVCKLFTFLSSPEPVSWNQTLQE